MSARLILGLAKQRQVNQLESFQGRATVSTDLGAGTHLGPVKVPVTGPPGEAPTVETCTDSSRKMTPNFPQWKCG